MLARGGLCSRPPCSCAAATRLHDASRRGQPQLAHRSSAGVEPPAMHHLQILGKARLLGCFVPQRAQPPTRLRTLYFVPTNLPPSSAAHAPPACHSSRGWLLSALLATLRVPEKAGCMQPMLSHLHTPTLPLTGAHSDAHALLLHAPPTPPPHSVALFANCWHNLAGHSAFPLARFAAAGMHLPFLPYFSCTPTTIALPCAAWARLLAH